MKRTFILLLLALLIVASAFGDSTRENTSFRVSAYKDAELPNLDYKITISNYESSSITGFTNEYDVSSKLTSSSLSFSNALVVKIVSNLKLDIPVQITFSPFVNQKNSSNTVPITYTFTKGSLEAVEADAWVSLRNYSGYNDYYYYRYTPGLILTDSSGTSVSSISTGSSGTTATLTHTIAKVERKDSYNYYGSWETVDSLPAQNGNTLPGFRNQQALTSTGYFALSISSTDYADMAANIDYEATISLLITSI